MNSPSTDFLLHWWANTPELLQRVCVMFVVTYVPIIWLGPPWFKRAMRGVDSAWRYRIVAAVYFGVLAIFGTHRGIVLDISKNGAAMEYLSWLPTDLQHLQHLQAILSFRDMLVLSAGLYGGPWTGLGAGLIAGVERWLLGGFVGFASGFSTLVLGLGAGLAKQFWPNINNYRRGTLAVVLVGSAVQKCLIVLLSDPHELAIVTILETIIPETAVNCLGCLLFLSVMQAQQAELRAQQAELQAQQAELRAQQAELQAQQAELQAQQAERRAQQAELRALRAQIEPHFINNTLNSIKALIRRDPEQASDYVVKLARFLDDTRHIARTDLISLSQEITQLENYLDFQQLRFPGAFRLEHDIPASLLDCQIPPRSLLTLAENALLHGIRGHSDTLTLHITGADLGSQLELRIKDNGCGIEHERLKLLGIQPVDSERGSGNGLYQLKETLKIAFDGTAEFDIKSREKIDTTITLKMPKRSQPW